MDEEGVEEEATPEVEEDLLVDIVAAAVEKRITNNYSL